MTDLIALVVEDSAVQRKHLVGLLQDLQIGTVLQASDGNEALKVLLAVGGRPVYLLVTDIDMPGMDGIELMGKLTADHCIENLIVTSARDPRLLETVESMGAGNAKLNLLGTLIKPIAAPALTHMLEGARRNRPGGDKPIQAAMGLEDIRQALASRQFMPYFQPKVAVRTGLLKGVEALARWQHAELGLLSPASFIPSLEGSPLMAEFTLSMLDQSLQQLQGWARAMPTLTMSVNLAADNLADPQFIDRLIGLVKAYNVQPASVTWEVTETMVMCNEALANLARLGLKGFGLSMDDYGIGYSSMQTLSRSPFTELKIDRAFVHGASQRSNRRAILSSLLDMGRSLAVATVAEGVETVDDWNLLSELGCDIIQGYLVAKPMPADQLLGWTMGHRARLRKLAAEGSPAKPSAKA